MTVQVTIHPDHWFRAYILLKGMKRIGLRGASTEDYHVITGEASPEVIADISDTPGIQSIESVPPRATSTLSYSV